MEKSLLIVVPRLQNLFESQMKVQEVTGMHSAKRWLHRGVVLVLLVLSLPVFSGCTLQYAWRTGAWKGNIYVKVTDNAGNPVAGAQVQGDLSQLDSDYEYTAQTNEQGLAALSDLPLGTYDVEVTLDGATLETTRVRVVPNQSITLEVDTQS